jgi:catechol 2,3-dioxygenase-like lactoylglutathione lyase family enzyme
VGATGQLVSRINVVYLYVRDIGRSRSFYRDVLGIPLEGDDQWQEADLGGTRFALHASHEGVGEPSPGTVRVSFEIADVDEALAALAAAGIEAVDVARADWGSRIEIVDPDGYRVHLSRST